MSEKINSEFATYLQIFTDVFGFLGSEAPAEKTDWKYQLTPIEFSDSDKKRLNIGDSDKYYHLTCDGKTVVDGIFRQGGFSSSIKEINTKRFIRLLVYSEDRYSDSIVKECSLKSPYYLRGKDCIVDMESHEVVLVSADRTLGSIMSVYGNIAVTDTADGIGVFSLTERRWLLEDKDLKTLTEIDDFLFVTTGGYFPKGMFRISKTTCEVIDCCVK